MRRLLTLLIFALTWPLGCATAGTRKSLAPDWAPLTLAETWPVDTTLDNPDVMDAHIAWGRLFDGARTSLDICQFYVAPGGRLDPLLQSIEDAGKRGVKVRIIGDKKFYERDPGPLDALAAMKNIELRILDLEDKTGGIQHSKYFIVDGKTAFVGSQNMDGRSLEHIIELGVVMNTPALVEPLGAVFSLDWSLAGGEAPTVVIDGPQAASAKWPVPAAEVSYKGSPAKVQLVASPGALRPAGVDWELPAILRMIEGAESKVRVQVMTYELVGYDKSYWDTLDRALRQAARRGVEVELLVSHWNLRWGKLHDIQSLTVHKNLRVKVLTVPEHASGFIPFARVAHSKFMVVDGQRGWLGTSNWSRGYFEQSRNVGLVYEGASLAADMDAIFSRAWGSEYAEDLDPGKAYPKPRISK